MRRHTERITLLSRKGSLITFGTAIKVELERFRVVKQTKTAVHANITILVTSALRN